VPVWTWFNIKEKDLMKNLMVYEVNRVKGRDPRPKKIYRYLRLQKKTAETKKHNTKNAYRWPNAGK